MSRRKKRIFISYSSISSLERIRKQDIDKVRALEIESDKRSKSKILDRIINRLCKTLLEDEGVEKIISGITQLSIPESESCFLSGSAVTLETTLCKELPPTHSELKNRAEFALKMYRETGETYFADEYRDLVLRYKSALQNRLREIKYILASIKIPSGRTIVLDLRNLVRKNSKIISRNLDDEDVLLYNFFIEFYKACKINVLNHGNRNIKINHQRPRVFLL